MFPNRLRSFVAAAAIAAVASFVSGASAQEEAYTHAPFIENTQRQSQAFGLELVGLRLRLVDLFQPPIDINLVDEIVKLVATDYARFAGTLGQLDPGLNDNLFAVLSLIAQRVRDGEVAADLVPQARALLAQAYDLLIDPEIQATPEYKGALLADLLLGDGGVAEGFEEGTVQPWEYPAGWVALERVKVLWAEIEPLAEAEERDNGREMIAALDAILITPAPPANIMTQNREEAEAPAQRLVGIVERVVDASLYAGRDLGPMTVRLAEVTETACEAYAAGEVALGAEGIYAVRGLYRDYLDGTLSLLLPDLRWVAIEKFAGLIENFRDEGLAAAEGLRAGMVREEVAEILLRQVLILIYVTDPHPACLALAAVFHEAAVQLGGVEGERGGG